MKILPAALLKTCKVYDEDHREINTGNQEDDDQQEDFVKHSGLLS